MREIKFRAWDEKQKYMAYQGTPDLETIQSFFHHFGNSELMQFTGLTDKTGREIYEGDIIYVADFEMKYIVVFEDASFILNHVDDIYGKKWGLLSRLIELEKYPFEVIGNIHEKPEMI